MALKTYTWETGDYAYQSWSNGYKIHLTLTEESTSTANNTSLVSYKFWVSNGSNNRFYDNGWSWSISIGGQTIAINNFNFYVYPYNVTQTIASGQITVTHNSDGSLNMPYNVSVPNVKASNQYGMPAMAISGTWALTTIPRTSGVSCSTVNIGTAPTITIASASSSFTHKLTYAFGSLSGTIVERTSSTSYTGWVLPTTFYSQIPSATSGVGTITCYTYSGSTHIGTSSCSFTAKVNESISKPTITATITDNNATTQALTGDSSVLVRYYSTAYVSMSATALNGSSLVRQSITNGSTTFQTATATFANVDNGVFSLSATDTRGFTTTVGRNLVSANKFVSYVRLTCNIENTKPDASGNITVRCDGSYFNGSFGAVANTLTVKCRFKPQGGSYSSWHTMTVTKNGNYYGAYYSLTIPNFDYLSTYVFECQAIDKLATVSSSPNTAKSTPVFHWSKDNFVFEVPVTFNAGVDNSGAASAVATDQTIDGDLNVTGDLRLKGSGNYGNTLRFGDGSYCYITEPTDDVMTIKASSINLEANNVKVYGNPIPTLATGVWSPTLSSSAVSSYSTQYGWYSKMGQTVSVGFYVKATCRSGYNSTLVTIGGLPFTPMYTGAGGGMCSGAYVSAGFTFQCFVAETDGSITTRVQACNNTSTTNLSTSKSGCWYPSGGGDITISGTITYISG
jgi:hypothetical protein